MRSFAASRRETECLKCSPAHPGIDGPCETLKNVGGNGTADGWMWGHSMGVPLGSPPVKMDEWRLGLISGMLASHPTR